MNPIRMISLCAWAAIAAAWALPPKPAPAVVPNLDVTPIVAAAPSSSSAKLYAAGALPFAMEPVDLWALVNLKFKELPPVEFDHPTEEPVEIVDVESEARLRVLCGWPARSHGEILVGCAAARPGEFCRIFVGPPQTERSGVTRNIVIRHEIGHCNGWPGNHPGMR